MLSSSAVESWAPAPPTSWPAPASPTCRPGVRRVGGGSSAKPLGGVRAQFSDPANIALGARSLDAFRRFDDRRRCRHRPAAGRLSVRRSATPTTSRRFEPSVALQNSMGVPSRLVGAAEARQHCALPVASRDLVAAAWSPGRRLRPARRRRARLRRRGDRRGACRSALRPRVVRDRRNGRTVRPSSAPPTARYPTPTVVCAAGAWSRADRCDGGRRPADRAAAPPDRLHPAAAPHARPGCRSPSTTRPPRTSTAPRTAACCWAGPTPRRRPGSTATSAPTGTPSCATRCSCSPPRSPTCRSSAAGPGSTR